MTLLCALAHISAQNSLYGPRGGRDYRRRLTYGERPHQFLPLYHALRERGNDETFREHYKIVKTTSTEEAIIKEFGRDNCFGSFIR